VLDDEGSVVAATLSDEGAAQRIARAAHELLGVAARVRGDEAPALTQVEAAMPDGSVFVVCDDERAIVAATTSEPTVGLVFYDLKSCLRALAAGEQEHHEEPDHAKRASRKENASPDPEDDEAA